MLLPESKKSIQTVAVGIEDLIEFHPKVIEDTKRKLEQAIVDEKAETYPSPDKVCEILDINRSTLWRWNKRGYLKPIQIGGKRRYRMSDVKRILGEGKR